MRLLRNSAFWILALIVSLTAIPAPNNWAHNISDAGGNKGDKSSPYNPPGNCAAHGSFGGFSDVLNHYYACSDLDYIYTNLQAVSGYAGTDCTNHGVASPCFLPYATVTRGQFSKILVNTFSWCCNTSGGPHFADVPPGSTFYDYIETGYNRGIFAGYAGDPNYFNTCMWPWAYETPGLTYFRWCNPVTRGQMAKMVSNAAGFNDSTAGVTPSFLDVPSGSTFFDYIERLVMHAVNAQYPPGATYLTCYSSTQPCFFPSNSAPRIDAVEHIANASFRDSNSGYGQVFGHIGNGYPQYDGVSAYATTLDPFLQAGNFAAAPVGLTDRWNGHFIESGPQKKCLPNCELHPYGSWGDFGNNFENWDTNLGLTPGQAYQYKSVLTGNGIWQSSICYPSTAGVGCIPMITTADLGYGNGMPFAGAGGETSDLLIATLGTVTISNAQQSVQGAWSSWCYDPTLAPWRTIHSSIGPCATYGRAPYSWTVTR